MSNLEILKPIAPDIQKGAFETTQSNLSSFGSLLEGTLPLDKFDRDVVAEQFGINAAEKVVGLNTELLSRDPSDIVFAGGVCALSTRESVLLRQEAATEDVVTGDKVMLRETDDLSSLQDAVTAVQIFEAIGTSDYQSAIVVEDELWSERVAWFLRGLGDDEAVVAASGLVRSRNRQTVAGIDSLRNYLFGKEVEPVSTVSDSKVIDELTSETDRMLKEMGLEDITTPYRRVFAGMYSYVWRNVLQQAGVVAEDKVLAIFEPSKHIGREDGIGQDISRFKSNYVRNFPFMQAGASEKLGLIAYLEPRDPNGRRFRDAVPLALMPNSLNYRNFDFSKFPIVPKKKNDELADLTEFTYLDQMGNLSLTNNPVFLWGLMYPITSETARLLSDMQSISASYRYNARTRLGAITDGLQRKQAAETLKGSYSVEMERLAEELVEELQDMNQAMFGGQDEAQ